MRIVVFGGGMQGRVIAGNLINRKEKPAVVIADVKKPPQIPSGAQYSQIDVLEQAQVSRILKDADAAVLAVPSEIARQALENIIKAGIPVADVSFTPDPPLDLNDQAKQSGACVVVDCGIAPGLSHILVGSAYTELGGLDSAVILVGGIPQNPPGIFRHAVYFNPHDLIAEYIRPARARQKGKDIAPAPMDVPFENFQDEELGSLQTFLSDGLRSLLTSYKNVPEMAEKTIRWPGHLDMMKQLSEIGLFDTAAGASAVATAIGTKYPSDKYPDMLLMTVECRKGTNVRKWRMLDRFTDGQSAMSRTTGYTTASVAMVLARKQFSEPGVHAPERLGSDVKIAKAIVSDLNERGVVVTDLAVAASV